MSKIFLGAYAPRVVLAATASATVSLFLAACGSNWRMNSQGAIEEDKVSTRAAPDWVAGVVPGGPSEERIYFVGRSHTPDRPLTGPCDAETPDGRTGYTVMDERDAIQSARTDVQDQIRQRLMPRNYGTSANRLAVNTDSGQCTTCGTRLPALRSPIEKPCNTPCMYSAAVVWPSTANCRSCSNTSAACASAGGAPSEQTAVPGGCASCKGVHLWNIHDSVVEAVNLIDKMNELNRTTEFVDVPQYRGWWDVNMSEVAVDSVIPAALAELAEEETYFERWWVHEGHDAAGRPFAEGRDEWESYKCWIRCSLYRAAWERIVTRFRENYDDLYADAREHMQADRLRQREWELVYFKTALERQGEEREWNRDDEVFERNNSVAGRVVGVKSSDSSK